MARLTVVTLVLACGSAAMADASPELYPQGVRSGSRVVGHFYVNIGTGEVIGTVTPVVRPRGAGEMVWISDNDIPCAVVNSTAPYTLGYVAVHDDPHATNQWASYRSTLSDWADVAPDTVVDLVMVSTYADHPDTDLDGDGLADGVPGLAAEWNFFEGDNGFYGCDILPLIGFRLVNIPGNLTPGQIEGYMYTIDLSGLSGENLAFEFGDTDGDPQGAAVHNWFAHAGGALDLDADGLVDFSVSRKYFQPGTLLDPQGQPIGDPANRAQTYTGVAAPRMDLDPNPPTSFTRQAISSGSEDAFERFADPWGDGGLVHLGVFWFGGFSCDRDGDGVFEGDLNGSDANNDGIEDNDYRPYASFFMAMYGPGEVPPCPADFYPPPAGDGVLNFFDLSYFIARYGQNDPITDFFPPGGDGVLNFFDVVAYINAFNAGCP